MEAAQAVRRTPSGRMLRPYPAHAAVVRRRYLAGSTARGTRVGSQVRSTARDSRSLPEGVPRFESWPTHRIRPFLWAREKCTHPLRGMHEPSRETTDPPPHIPIDGPGRAPSERLAPLTADPRDACPACSRSFT